MATLEENIKHSLKKNGFPEKKVSLPFKALFSAAKKENANLSEILKKLEESNIFHVIEGDKVLFSSEISGKSESTSETESEPWKNFDFSNEMVQDAMKKISEMDPKELERIKEQVTKMTPDEKSELLKNAKDLFKNKSE